ncbi:MAG: hypothetical protein J2P23_11680 [Microlunatus sp.]|nr:hypothetical protein [Microlunatus sp.]
MSRKAPEEEQHSGSGARSGERIDVVNVRPMLLAPGLPTSSYARHGLGIVDAPGTADAGCRGEITVCLIDPDTRTPIESSSGDPIARPVIRRVSRARLVTVSQLPGSIRGSDGHGSTGGMPAEPTNEPVGTVAADVRPDDTDSTPQENR